MWLFIFTVEMEKCNKITDKTRVLLKPREKESDSRL